MTGFEKGAFFRDENFSCFLHERLKYLDSVEEMINEDITGKRKQKYRQDDLELEFEYTRDSVILRIEQLQEIRDFMENQVSQIGAEIDTLKLYLGDINERTRRTRDNMQLCFKKREPLEE